MCREPVVEGSLFCARHRAQAALFSKSFGRDAMPEATAAAAAPDAEPTAPRRPSANVVSELVQNVFAQIATPPAADAPLIRWPQISIYYLQDQLYGRPYYCVVPQAARTASGARLDLQAPAVQQAMRDDGMLMKDFVQRFGEYEAELKRRHIQTLDLHFLTYTGLVAINLHRAAQKDLNLATYRVTGDALEPVPLADVRPLMQHQRW